MRADTKVREVPQSAYIQASEIKNEEKCPACNGLGYICLIHGSHFNEYDKCYSCEGSGRKSKEEG
jgi:DnaJ-class molecular chaperone